MRREGHRPRLAAHRWSPRRSRRSSNSAVRRSCLACVCFRHLPFPGIVLGVNCRGGQLQVVQRTIALGGTVPLPGGPRGRPLRSLLIIVTVSQVTAAVSVRLFMSSRARRSPGNGQEREGGFSLSRCRRTGFFSFAHPPSPFGGCGGMLRGRACLLYTSPSPRDRTRSRMPSSA